MSTFLFQTGNISPLLWMMISGFGMYICYVPLNGLFFDRMIATYKINGDVGFLIYLADSFGYIASVFILFCKSLIAKELSWVGFFVQMVYITSFIGIVTALFSYIYFRNKYSVFKGGVEGESIKAVLA